MTKKLVTFLIAAAVAGSLAAQTGSHTPPTPDQIASRRVQQLTTLLDLTADQQQQAKTLFAAEAMGLQALQPQAAAARQAMQNAIKNTGLDADIESAAAQQASVQSQIATLQGKTQAKFRAVLTPDQKQKLDALAGKGRMGAMGGPGAMGGRFAGRGRGF